MSLNRNPYTKSSLPPWFFPGLLIIVVIVLNLNTMRNGFTIDDRELLDTEWPAISQPWEVFRAAPAGLPYEPIQRLSLMVNRTLGGADPRGFHGTNIALHLLVTLLVFLLSTRILEERTAGFAAALLFAIHPVHVEAIQTLRDRGVLLGAAAIFAALWLFMRERDTGRARLSGNTAAIAGLYAFALFSTGYALVFPALWVLAEVHFQKDKSWKHRIQALAHDVRFWSLLAVTGIYFAARNAAVGSVLSSGDIEFIRNPLAFAGVTERVLTAVDVIRRCLVLLVWPFRLSPDYSFDAVPLITNLWSTRLLSSAAILAGVIVLAFWGGRKKSVYLYYYLFFLVSVSIISNLFFPIQVTMAEGLLYVPSVAICWAVVQFFLDLGWIPSDRQAAEASKLRRLKLIALLLICLVVPGQAKPTCATPNGRMTGRSTAQPFAPLPEMFARASCSATSTSRRLITWEQKGSTTRRCRSTPIMSKLPSDWRQLTGSWTGFQRRSNC